MKFHSLSLMPSFSENIFSDRFNQIDKMFSTLTGEKPISSSPVYDLIQKNEKKYELIISLPGYSEDDLDISVHKNQLKIIGNQKKSKLIEKKEKILHSGIRKNNFSLVFNLDNHVEVKKANLNLGILTIEFEYEIPEKEKPKKIIIENKKEKITNSPST
ncbi:Hsp20 family protein [Buchnera aphidicola (Mindarus keteleerifoliae)]|uniref:Hsp20 family protein n=1 Tax=Buchnera aphidicola TaxID=9 RepID=UPI0031B72F46